MSERHAKSMHGFLHNESLEGSESYFGKQIVIENKGGKKLLGVLVEKSIAISLSATAETEHYLKTMVQTNLMELEIKPGEKLMEKACRTLNLPFAGKTNGIYSDPQAFGQIMAIHLHPEEHLNSQQEFIDLVNGAFEIVGLKLSIVEFS